LSTQNTPQICKILAILERKNPHVPLHPTQPASTPPKKQLFERRGKKENPTPNHYKPLRRKEENKYPTLPLSSP